MSRRVTKEGLLLALLAASVYALAYGVRARDLDACGMLGDSAGPWLAAYASPVNRHAHAPPYGWGLHPPYALALAAAGSLRQAVANLQGFHALVAPLAVLLAWRPGRLAPALVAGLLLALDGGLLDTARSGSEAYLAAVWVGATALCARFPRSAPLAGPCWAMASMNHPLALATAPLVLVGGRRGLLGLPLGLAMLAPQLPRWWAEAPGGGRAALGDAARAWFDQGGPAAFALVAGPLLALRSPAHRREGVATLASLGLLVLFGWKLGNLRDHHLRLLSVPAAAGLGALPGLGALAPLLLLRWPLSELPPPGHPHRPGTLGLTTAIARSVAALPQPLFVDGAWRSGTPAAEPGAVMLALRLQGVQALGPGGTTVVIVSYERGEEPAFSPRFLQGDRFFLATEDLSVLADTLCGQARLGGAYNGLAALRPELGLQEAAWRAGCPEEAP